MSNVRLPEVSSGRRMADRLGRGTVMLGTLIALIPLALLIGFLLVKGLGAINGSFFTSDPSGRSCFPGQTSCDIGGVRSAIVGTLIQVGLAAAVAIPFGIMVAVYLVEIGKKSLFANFVRYLVDVMTGVPSVVFGLFVYIVLVVTQVGGTAGAAWKGSAALALLMMPIVVNACEPVLRLVPDQIREGALALGAPHWKVILRIVLPTALPGLVTASLLAIARAAGETAPVLFVVGATFGLTTDPNGPMNSLPLQIFSDVRSPSDALNDRAWGGALTLVGLILILSLGARLIQSRSKIK